MKANRAARPRERVDPLEAQPKTQIASSRPHPRAAVAIALICSAALAAHFGAVLDTGMSAPRAFWVMLREFPILTDLGIAAVFTGVALGKHRFANQSLLGGLTASAGLVAVGSPWLLDGAHGLSDETPIADALLYCAVPIMVILFWLELAPKGRLTLRDAILWAVYPLAYFDYAILRGAAENHFIYEFLNGIDVGWGRTFWTAVLILAGFVDAGLALVWLDGRLTGTSNAADRAR